MAERGRPRRGCLAGLALAVVVFAVTVVAVVLALRVFTATDSGTGRCTAPLEDETLGLAPDQADNAALMGAVALRRELPARAVTIAIATAMQESRLRNIDYGDRDSVGLFQQRPSQGWGTVEEIMDPVYSTNAFYDVLVTVEGWESAEVTDAAQDVQRSAFPDAYAQHESRGRAFASSLTGYSTGALVCRLDPAADGGGSAAGALDAVSDRLARDFVDIGLQRAEDHLLVDATTLPAGLDDAPARRGWALAQWAVATAEATGVSVVATDGQAWVRDDGAEAGWAPVGDSDLPESVARALQEAGPGAVVIA